MPQAAPHAPSSTRDRRRLVRRHGLSTRLCHGTNAASLVVLLMSGLMIFNAHPRLYWGDYGANPDPAWLEITHEAGRGYLRVGGAEVETTGSAVRGATTGGR